VSRPASLAELTQFFDNIAPGVTAAMAVYTIPDLYLAAAAESRTRLMTGFHAYPFTEPANGKVYARARWYDPHTGTFMSPDPMGYQDSSNMYAFCGGDPINCLDPTGQWGFKDAWNQLQENATFAAGVVVGELETAVHVADNLHPIVGNVNRVREVIPRARRMGSAYASGGVRAAIHEYGSEVADYALDTLPVVSTIRNGQGIADTYYREGAFAAGRQTGATLIGVAGDTLAVYAGARGVQAMRARVPAVSQPDVLSVPRTWNEFQSATKGQFGSRAEAGAAWREIKGVTGELDVLASRPAFWVETEHHAWRAAADGPNGTKLCPTCDTKITGTKIRGVRDFDLDHYVQTWAQLKIELSRIPGLTRRQVIEAYQRNVRVQCPGCNRSNRFSPAGTNDAN
jgi:RHS repeat-associated protein